MAEQPDALPEARPEMTREGGSMKVCCAQSAPGSPKSKGPSSALCSNYRSQ